MTKRRTIGSLLLGGILALGPLLAGAARAEPAHDFELYDLTDRLVRLARVRQTSKLVVVDFFSDTCKPCKAALPAWRRLAARFADQGLSLLLVAVPDAGRERAASRAAIERYFQEHSVPFPVVWDKYGLVAKQYRVARQGKLLLPRAFLLDAAGRLLLQHPDPGPIAAAVAKRLAR